MSTVALPEIAIELACCHLVAMTDMKMTAFTETDQGPGVKPGAQTKISVGKNIREFDILGQAAVLVSKDTERIEMSTSHIDMMNRAIKILIREGIDPDLYRLALAKARTLPDHERTRMVLEGQFTEEMIPPEAFRAIINCVMDG